LNQIADGARLVLDRVARTGLDLRPYLRRLLPPPPAPGLVSIILPTRNRAAYIARALDSVLAQSYKNWELIIIDDGSTDATKAILRPYLTNRRIRCHKQPPKGAACARNAGLRIARGEFIAYLDSDNDWEPAYLETMLASFAEPQTQSAYAALLRHEGTETPSRHLQSFDHARLRQANFIDLNIYMHRASLIAQFGNFDETLTRLSDWDLILRYTQTSPALMVDMDGANYHTNAENRISVAERFHTAYRKIRAKWRHYSKTPRPLRVLYALWHYPQISENYVEVEIQAMLRLGVQIEVWSEEMVSAPYKSSVPVHRLRLEDAIAQFQPDIIHVHWLNIAHKIIATPATGGIPMTVRSHGFDTNDAQIHALLIAPDIHKIYLFDHQISSSVLRHPKFVPIRTAFDTTRIVPHRPKNPHLVMRVTAGIISKDLPAFLELAKKFPEHRFVLIPASCTFNEHYIGELLKYRREIQSPAEILINAPHGTVMALLAEAGIYLHTAHPPEAPHGTPIGMPISIAEAMASGCYILHRNLAPLIGYVSDAGAAYANLEEAEQLIAETANWDAAAWRRAATRSIERAWTFHTGEDDFHRIYEDWVSLTFPA
jgi:glycosyltransferase involved in cell wall biosynthesis